MNKENFLEALKRKYTIEMSQLYADYAHDVKKMVQQDKAYHLIKKKLYSLLHSALGEGLVYKEFEDLMFSILPEDLMQRLLSDEKDEHQDKKTA